MRIAVYNIWNGGDGRTTAIEEVVTSIDPDAVALLEAGDPARMGVLANRLGLHLAFGEANSEFPVAWLTRKAILHAVNHRHPALAKTLLQVDVEYRGQPLSMFATHLTPGVTPADCQAREAEIEVILSVLRSANPRHVLVGDFNAVHPADDMGRPPPNMEHLTRAERTLLAEPIRRLLNAGYTDAYRAMHLRARGFTWRSDHLWLRLDFAFLAPALSTALLDCDVVVTTQARRASDHLPLRVVLR